MTSYIVDVSELLEYTGAAESIGSPFDLGVLKVGDAEYPLVEPASVDVLLTNAGSGIVAAGSVEARVNAECSRCLRNFEMTIRGSVEGYYVAGGDNDEESEPVFPDQTIDLAPALIAALVIETPFAPLHDPDCKGLCPECGTDLNVADCECGSEPDDTHPFASLRGLLKDDTDTSE